MSETQTSLKKLKVPELKEKCQEYGLDTKGTKQVLIDRITEHLNLSGVSNPGSSKLEDSLVIANSPVVDKSPANVVINEDSKTVPDCHAKQTNVCEKVVDKNRDDASINKKSVNKDGSSIVSELKHDAVELDFVNDESENEENKRSICEQEIDADNKSQQTESKDKRSHLKIEPTKMNKEEKETQTYAVRYMDHMHLDPYVNDLHFTMNDDNYLKGGQLTSNELNNFFCGVKATHGVVHGMVYFSCMYLSDIPTKRESDTHFLRVGFSCIESGLHLGDDALSCGYESTGKLFSNGKVEKTGSPFGVGDTLTVAIAIAQENIKFSFILNNTDIGMTTVIPTTNQTPRMFPHVYFKNCTFEVDFKTPINLLWDYLPIEMNKEELIIGPRPPTDQAKCQIVLTVGLLACGKSTWVKKYMSENQNLLRYDVIGRTFFHDRWRMIGQTKRVHLSERVVSSAITKFISLAQNRARNFIIDQTNLMENTRRRRLETFKNFQTKKAVLVLPRLSEYATRIEKYRKEHENVNSDDRPIFDEDIIDSKERISIPTIEEGFSEIIYVDCDEKAAPQIVADYRYDASRFRELNPKTNNKRVKPATGGPNRGSAIRTRHSPIRHRPTEAYKPSDYTGKRRFVTHWSPPKYPSNRNYSPHRRQMYSPKIRNARGNNRNVSPRPSYDQKYKGVGKSTRDQFSPKRHTHVYEYGRDRGRDQPQRSLRTPPVKSYPSNSYIKPSYRSDFPSHENKPSYGNESSSSYNTRFDRNLNRNNYHRSNYPSSNRPSSIDHLGEKVSQIWNTMRTVFPAPSSPCRQKSPIMRHPSSQPRRDYIDNKPSRLSNNRYHRGELS